MRKELRDAVLALLYNVEIVMYIIRDGKQYKWAHQARNTKSLITSLL